MQSLAKCRHAVSYRRTLDHLRAWSLQLPNSVNEAVVTFHANDSDHTGTVMFLYQHVPQLRYHNPAVKFSFIEDSSLSHSSITLHHDDGRKESLNTTGLSHSEVKHKLETELLRGADS